MSNFDHVDQTIDQQSRKGRLWQFVVIAIIASLFALRKPELGIAAVYGGLVSVFIAWTLSWAAIKATEVSKQDPKKGIAIMYISAVVRFFMVLVLFAVGIGLLGLNPIPLVATAVVVWVVGLVVPHVGKRNTTHNSVDSH